MGRLNIKKEISSEIHIYKQMCNSYSKQDKPVGIQSCVSSKQSLATNSGSCQFQISYFNIADHPGILIQKACDENILALLLPFMGLLESTETLTMAPLRLYDWH